MNNNSKLKNKNLQARFNIFIMIACGMVLTLIFHTICLNQEKKEFFFNHANSRALRTKLDSAKRGMILDRNNIPLAVSSKLAVVSINPQKLNLNDKNIGVLLNLLEISFIDLVYKFNSNARKKFVYLKRKINPELARKIQSLGIKGVDVGYEYSRHYPLGETASHVVGFTGIDNSGMEGIENTYDNWLKGENGAQSYFKDLRGRNIEVVRCKSSKEGNTLNLTLDAKLQYLAYKSLEKAVKKHNADKASVVILDVNSGEVLAMANYPSFNPNDLSALPKNIRNTAVTDAFEPGSTIKTFSVGAILADGSVNVEKPVNTSPGKLVLQHGVIKDLRDYGQLSLTEILQRSSNVGLSKLILQIPKEKLFKQYKLLGFGENSLSGLPGEASGKINQKTFVSNFELATNAFGYGLAITPLQLASAYAAIGADGVRITPTIIKDRPQERVQAFSPEVAYKLRLLLEKVSDAPLSKAKIKGYKLGGKSGTVRKLVNNNYVDNKHISFYGGLAPISQPKFSIVVMVDNPKINGYYGNSVAAPIFSDIARTALRLYNVNPNIRLRA